MSLLFLTMGWAGSVFACRIPNIRPACHTSYCRNIRKYLTGCRISGRIDSALPDIRPNLMLDLADAAARGLPALPPGAEWAWQLGGPAPVPGPAPRTARTTAGPWTTRSSPVRTTGAAPGLPAHVKVPGHGALFKVGVFFREALDSIQVSFIIEIIYRHSVTIRYSSILRLRILYYMGDLMNNDYLSISTNNTSVLFRIHC